MHYMEYERELLRSVERGGGKGEWVWVYWWRGGGGGWVGGEKRGGVCWMVGEGGGEGVMGW